jgi:hypothetical protein
MSAAFLTLSAANGQAPAGPQCEEPTENPWITSGYCAAHDAWSRYYCRCDFELGDDDDDDDDDDADVGREPPRGDDLPDDADDDDGDVIICTLGVLGC